MVRDGALSVKKFVDLMENEKSLAKIVKTGRNFQFRVQKLWLNYIQSLHNTTANSHRKQR